MEESYVAAESPTEHHPVAAVEEPRVNSQSAHAGIPQHAVQQTAMTMPATSCHASTGCSSDCNACVTWQPCMPQYCTNPQEYLCDGGDQPPSAVVTESGQIAGLDTKDTVVAFHDRDGRPEVVASNCTCVYAPRFAAVRKVSAALQGEKTIAAVGYDLKIGAVPMDGRLPGVIVSDVQGPTPARLVLGPDGYRVRNRAVPLVGEEALIQAQQFLGAFAGIALLETGALVEDDLPLLHTSALAAEIWTGRDVVDVLIDGQVAVEMSLNRAAEELKEYEVRGKGRLRICKVADRGAAQPGDSVTFVLRVDNVGDGPVNNIVISDNLTTRLEYVDQSQACTKGAIFAAKPNEAGSTTLQWQLTDDMKVGEGCIIRFRCKVR